MANKRILKKKISYIAGELFTEALLCDMFIQDEDKEKVDTLLSRIIEMEEAFILRANRPDAKNNKVLVKEYYRKLQIDLQKETDEIGKELEKLNKGTK